MRVAENHVMHPEGFLQLRANKTRAFTGEPITLHYIAAKKGTVEKPYIPQLLKSGNVVILKTTVSDTLIKGIPNFNHTIVFTALTPDTLSLTAETKGSSALKVIFKPEKLIPALHPLKPIHAFDIGLSTVIYSIFLLALFTLLIGFWFKRRNKAVKETGYNTSYVLASLDRLQQESMKKKHTDDKIYAVVFDHLKTFLNQQVFREPVDGAEESFLAKLDHACLQESDKFKLQVILKQSRYVRFSQASGKGDQYIDDVKSFMVNYRDPTINARGGKNG